MAKAAKKTRGPSSTPLTDKQREVLDSLSGMRDWAAPMYFGGRDGSHHSDTMRRLVDLGLAERKKLHAIYCYHGSTQRQKLVDNRWVTTDGHPPSKKCCCKGSCRYRITPAGRKALQ
jgi:hypothetical protein